MLDLLHYAGAWIVALSVFPAAGCAAAISFRSRTWPWWATAAVLLFGLGIILLSR